MQYPGYNTGNIILTEGEWFPFRIHKFVQLQDEEWYYILEDINGLRHFISAEYYKKYGFHPGDRINCKIDKINCTGRIFLEPRHPFYNEGETYLFDVVKYPDDNDPKNIIITEIFGNTIKVPLSMNVNSEVNAEIKLRCIVKSIKKGIPILEISPK